jgi:hypothetical protein
MKTDSTVTLPAQHCLRMETTNMNKVKRIGNCKENKNWTLPYMGAGMSAKLVLSLNIVKTKEERIGKVLPKY